MGNFLWGILVGVAVSIAGFLIWFKNKEIVVSKQDVTELAHEKHIEVMAKLRKYIVGKTEVANDEVQSFLGVSDASAERYLSELEKAGLLKQVGTVGQQVKYKVI